MDELPGVFLQLHTTKAKGNFSWVHMIPGGTFSGTDGRGPFHLADAAAVVSSSIPPGGRPLPVDYNHQIFLVAQKGGGEAPAAGWIHQLQSRQDGIWGKVEWTAAASAAIGRDEYRFISPAFSTRPDGTVGSLRGAALTNLPNLAQLTALHTRQQMSSNGMAAVKAAVGAPDDADDAAVVAAVNQLVGSMATFQGALANILGMEPTVGQDAIREGVRALATSKHTVDPSQFVPLELFRKAVDEVKSLNSGISLHAAEMVVDKAISDRKMFHYMRDWAIQLCTVNRVAFDNFLDGPGARGAEFLQDLDKPAKQGGWAGKPPSGGASKPVSEIHKRLGLNAEEVEKYGV